MFLIIVHSLQYHNKGLFILFPVGWPLRFFSGEEPSNFFLDFLHTPPDHWAFPVFVRPPLMEDIGIPAGNPAQDLKWSSLTKAGLLM